MDDDNILRQSVKKAIKWSSITELLAKLVSPVANMILARIISPEAFGVVATVTMVCSFADMFSDAGFQKYLIQHPFRSERETWACATVAFWTNLALSVVLWAVIALSSEQIAVVVGNPGLGNVITVACIQLVFTSFSSVQIALRKRDLDFKGLFAARMMAAGIPFAVTIPLALLGLGHWALVAGLIAVQLSNALVLTIRSKWRPTFFFRFSLLKDMLGFSLWSMLEAITIWLTVWVDIFVVGTLFSGYYLGLYKTSLAMVSSLVSLITASFVPVLYSALCRLNGDEEKFRRMYFSIQKAVSMIIFPAGVLLLVFRNYATSVFFGRGWAEAADIVGVWGITGSIIVVLSNLCSEAYRSRGKPRLSVLAQALHLIVLVPVCFLSAGYGFWPFVYARSLIRIEFVLVHFVIMQASIGIRIPETLKNILPPAVAAAGMGTVGWFAGMLPWGVGWTLASIFTCCLVYVGLLCLFSQTRYDLVSAMNNNDWIIKGRMTMSTFFVKLKRIFASPEIFLLKLNELQLLNFLPDTVYLRLIYRARMKKRLNIKNPATFNEKLNWMKLNDGTGDLSRFSDKFEVRQYVREKIGEKHLVPLLGVYIRFEDIDFGPLPDRFVLKCTHDSGTNVVVSDKSKLDVEQARKKLARGLRRNYYFHGRERQYKGIMPRIICEEFVKTADGLLPWDYKIFCFHGKPEFLLIVSDRGKGANKIDFFSIGWERLPLAQHYPNSAYDIPRPPQLDEMIRCAKALSAGFPHVRVDFYIDRDGAVLFGEMTFSHFSGFERFIPDIYDRQFGDLLVLPGLGGQSAT